MQQAMYLPGPLCSALRLQSVAEDASAVTRKYVQVTSFEQLRHRDEDRTSPSWMPARRRTW